MIGLDEEGGCRGRVYHHGKGTRKVSELPRPEKRGEKGMRPAGQDVLPFVLIHCAVTALVTRLTLHTAVSEPLVSQLRW